MKMKIALYEDTRGEWRWRMRASNGRIVASGGEGFSSKSACLDSVTNVWNTFASDNCTITEVEKDDP